MLLAVVEGNAVTTIRHPSLKGWKVLIVQPVDIAGRPDGDVIMAIDMLGAGVGARVVISNDGSHTRQMVGDNLSPLRWSVIGVVD
jgi:ethanolamine utilization protein EutN